MTLDLSYIAEQPSEAQEEAVRKAIEFECLLAITQYLNEVADAMDTNDIQFIDSANLRAMANTLLKRISTDGENENAQN